jgi:hypothetical protein
MPDIVTFAESPTYLGKRLYPRQKSLLRLIYLETDHMTQYDVDVISEWAESLLSGGDRVGVSPDVWARVKWLQENGYPHFREVVNISGRRGSKGLMGAIMAAYQNWKLIQLDDPQWHYGIERGKELYFYITASGLAQARSYQFADFANAVINAPCFKPFIASAKPSYVTFRTPGDVRRIADLTARGVTLEREIASLINTAVSANSAASRGGAAFGVIFDELAHMLLGSGGGPRTADSVYNALTPSLDQMGKDAFIYVGTSPFTKVGRAYAQPVDVLVLTPTRWIPMGQVEPGTQLMGLDGRPTTVTAVHPRGSQEVFRVTFSDGASTRCTADHRWSLQDAQDRRDVYSTNQIISRLQAGSNDLQLPSGPLSPPDRRVISVEKEGTAEVQCVTVDSADSLYLTEHYIPTHNSLYTDGLATDPMTGEPMYPNMLVAQLPSWSIYEDHTRPEIVGPIPFRGAPQLYDDAAKRLEQREPTVFRVERKAQWAEVIDAYLSPKMVDRMFDPWLDRSTGNMVVAEEQENGVLRWTYYGHADPASSECNFAAAVGHCYDDQTEVLTRQGWRYFADVSTADQLATFSPDGEMRYQTPSEVVAVPYEGPMYTYEKPHLNFSVTPNHRMIFWNRHMGRREERLAQELPNVKPLYLGIPKASLKPVSQSVIENRIVAFRRPDRYELPSLASILPVTWGLCECGCGEITKIASVTRTKDSWRKGVPRPYIKGHKRQWWTGEQLRYLRLYWNAAESVADLAERLSKSESTIYHEAMTLGLPRRPNLGGASRRRPNLPACDIADFAAFVGIWLAEGDKTKIGWNTVIHQVKGEGVEWIDALIDRLGWPCRRRVKKRPGRRDRVFWYIHSDQLADYLRGLVDLWAHELSLPDWQGWPEDAQLALLKGLCIGDGTYADIAIPRPPRRPDRRIAKLQADRALRFESLPGMLAAGKSIANIARILGVSTGVIYADVHRLDLGSLLRHKADGFPSSRSIKPETWDGSVASAATLVSQQCYDYTSCSKRLVDEIQQLLLHRGVAGRIYKSYQGDESVGGPWRQKGVRRSKWHVTIPKGVSSHTFFYQKHLRVIDYTGTVYCATVPDGALFVRRNGVPMVCGNSRPYIDEDGDEWEHVILDKLMVWKPEDFPDHQIDYGQVEEELTALILAFPAMASFSYDQYGSFVTVPQMRKHLAAARSRTRVEEVTFTASANKRRFETFKAALGMGWVHSYADSFGPDEESLLGLELKFLQERNGVVDRQKIGPVRTKDLSDCFDSESSVLTESGWKSFPDVQMDERVATRSPTGELEYQFPTDRIDKLYEGPMLKYEQRRLNFLVTPGHRMLVTPYSGIKDEFVRADQLQERKLHRIHRIVSPVGGGLAGNTQVELRRAVGFTASLVPTDTIKPEPIAHTDQAHYSQEIHDEALSRLAVGDSQRFVAKSMGIGRTTLRRWLAGEYTTGRGRGWTVAQDDYLRDHYADTSMQDLMAVLGRSRTAVYVRANKVLMLGRGQLADIVGNRPPELPPVALRDFAAFVGFWLGDGSKIRRMSDGGTSGYAIAISQTKPAGIEWLDGLFKRLQWPFRKTTYDGSEYWWYVQSYELREYLVRLQAGGGELRLPPEALTQWDLETREALLEGLCRSDGTWRPEGWRPGCDVGSNYGSTSRMLVDDIQRLLMTMGRSGSIRLKTPAGTVRGACRSTKDFWNIHMDRRANAAILQSSLVETVPYRGTVHCLTVPNGTLFVRRGGIAMWTGNCVMVVTEKLVGAQLERLRRRQALSNTPILAGAPGGYHTGTDPPQGMGTARGKLKAYGNARSRAFRSYGRG